MSRAFGICFAEAPALPRIRIPCTNAPVVLSGQFFNVRYRVYIQVEQVPRVCHISS
jgi:hypothetical protein